MAGTASTERHEQSVEATPETTTPEATAVKQTAITDFFSPRSSTPLTYITPCPSVRLTRIPAVFLKQANTVDGDKVFDPTHPLFEQRKPSSMPSLPASPKPATEDVASNNASSSSELANTEADHKAEIERMRLVHEHAIEEMQQKLDRKDTLAKSATKFAEAAAAKLAANLAKETDVRADSVAVSQLTKQRDNLLKELESSRGKITDLTRCVQETIEELATAVMRIDDTRAALAAANAETVAAKAETEEATKAASTVLRTGEIARIELISRGNLIQKLLDGKGHEVIKERIRLTTFLRAENEDFEQQLHAASLENTSLRKDAKAAADDLAKNRRLMSSYKKELQSCNAKLLELESTPGTSSSSLAAANLLRDRDQALAELSTRVKEVALLHQLETKYENHVMELQADLECMYQENSGLEQELRKMERKFKRENRDNDRLQQKVTLFESNTLLMSRWNDICNKHAILNVLMTEKLTLEKNCASQKKENATLEERHTRFERSIQDFKLLVHDLLHRIIRLSRALESRGAYPFNHAYEDITDRILLVADLKAEHVYGDATTNFSEHEFDTKEMDSSDDEASYDEENEGDEDEEHDRDGDNNNADDNGGRTDGGNHKNNLWAGGEHKVLDDRSMPNEGCEDNNGGSQDCENADVSNGGKDVASTSSSGSGPNPVSSAPTSLAEEVDKSATVAADLEEVLKSENEPSFLKAVPAAGLEAKSKGKAPIFKSHPTPEPAENNTPASKNPEAKPGNEATEVQKEAATTKTEKAILFSQPQGFDFGGNSGPVSFTASSSSFPARENQPASTRMFSFKGQTSASVPTEPKEKAAEDSVAKDENLGEEMPMTERPKTEPPKEKAPEEAASCRGDTPKEETPGKGMPEIDAPEDGSFEEKKLRKELLKEESAPAEEEMPKGTPASIASGLPLSRNQKRTAKKKQKKVAKNAENEAMNAKVQESRGLQQAMGREEGTGEGGDRSLGRKIGSVLGRTALVIFATAFQWIEL